MSMKDGNRPRDRLSSYIGATLILDDTVYAHHLDVEVDGSTCLIEPQLPSGNVSSANVT